MFALFLVGVFATNAAAGEAPASKIGQLASSTWAVAEASWSKPPSTPSVTPPPAPCGWSKDLTSDCVAFCGGLDGSIIKGLGPDKGASSCSEKGIWPWVPAPCTSSSAPPSPPTSSAPPSPPTSSAPPSPPACTETCSLFGFVTYLTYPFIVSTSFTTAITTQSLTIVLDVTTLEDGSLATGTRTITPTVAQPTASTTAPLTWVTSGVTLTSGTTYEYFSSFSHYGVFLTATGAAWAYPTCETTSNAVTLSASNYASLIYPSASAATLPAALVEYLDSQQEVIAQLDGTSVPACTPALGTSITASTTVSAVTSATTTVHATTTATILATATSTNHISYLPYHPISTSSSSSKPPAQPTSKSSSTSSSHSAPPVVSVPPTTSSKAAPPPSTSSTSSTPALPPPPVLTTITTCIPTTYVATVNATFPTTSLPPNSTTSSPPLEVTANAAVRLANGVVEPIAALLGAVAGGVLLW